MIAILLMLSVARGADILKDSNASIYDTFGTTDGMYSTDYLFGDMQWGLNCINSVVADLGIVPIAARF